MQALLHQPCLENCKTYLGQNFPFKSGLQVTSRLFSYVAFHSVLFFGGTFSNLVENTEHNCYLLPGGKENQPTFNRLLGF